MPRKSPRSRKKPASPPRLPGTNRPRAAPGRGRKRRRDQPAVVAGAHTPKGARPSRAKAATPAAKRPTRPRPAAAGVRRRSLKPARRPARASRSTRPDPERVAALLGLLERLYPDAQTALHFESPLQLLIATILSAQCTDERVNKVTPVLFERYPDAGALAAAPLPDLEDVIRSTGFFRNKARAIQSCCRDIVEQHGGEVPRTMEQLTALRGVGRKTANVVLGNAFGIPGLVVDTHVGRLANRLGLTRERDAVKVEHALMEIIPREKWTLFSHWLILHGRQVCIARKPRCSICALAVHCPRVGVTTSQ